MRETLSKLFPTWVFWAGFVFTVSGVVYSIGNNLPWIAFLSLLPWLIGALDVAVRSQSENRQIRRELEVEQSNHADTQRKLQTISADHLIRIEELLLRGTVEECFDTIHAFSAYVGRLKKLTKMHFDVREVFVAGEALYIAAKTPATALEYFRENDAFLMYVKRSGLNHPIAKLRLHQVNEKQEAIFLQVVSELDMPTIASLRSLAQSASARGLKDFGISPELSTEPFAGHDMDAVTRTLEIIRENLSA